MKQYEPTLRDQLTYWSDMYGHAMYNLMRSDLTASQEAQWEQRYERAKRYKEELEHILQENAQ